MANLQIKGIQDAFYAKIKELAAAENRSVSQQILFLVKEHLGKRRHIQGLKTPAQVLLELSGSWEDDREAEQIVRDIKSARKSSRKLAQEF
jgi:hypothetical protein